MVTIPIELEIWSRRMARPYEVTLEAECFNANETAAPGFEPQVESWELRFRDRLLPEWYARKQFTWLEVQRLVNEAWPAIRREWEESNADGL